MTKEEKIKEAYGEHWFEMEDYMQEIVLQNNGWISTMFMPGYNAFSGEHVNIEIEKDNGIIRPKSLQGIENNNCWIKIESEDDLPKENIDCFYITKYSKDVIVGCFRLKSYKGWRNMFTVDHNIAVGLGHVTHYRPIVKPKPPIY